MDVKFRGGIKMFRIAAPRLSKTFAKSTAEVMFSFTPIFRASVYNYAFKKTVYMFSLSLFYI
jgi:hypothetical protein